MQGEWITLSALGTFGGTVFAVTLICQFLKGALDRLAYVPTRFLTLVTAWTVLVGYRYVTTGHLVADGLFLDGLNGFMVALASMGAHSLAKDNLNWN